MRQLPRTIVVFEKASNRLPPLLQLHIWALRELGFRVTVCFLADSASDTSIHAVNSDDVLCLGFDSDNLSGIRQRLVIAKKLDKVAKAIGAGVLFAHQFKAISSSVVANTLSSNRKLVGFVHGLTPTRASSRRRFYSIARCRIDALGCVSNAQKERVVADLPWISPRCAVVHNAFDHELVSRDFLDCSVARKKLRLTNDEYVIGCIARADRNKRIEDLLYAYSRARGQLPYPNRLVIIGDGEHLNALRQLSVSLGISDTVLFTGYLPEAWRLMRGLDLFVFPAVADAFGMVLLEAMAANLPVIACRAGGVPEVVGNEGVIVPPRSPLALAQAIVDIAQLPVPARRAMGDKASLRAATHFGPAAFLQSMKHLLVLSGVLQSKSGAGHVQ